MRYFIEVAYKGTNYQGFQVQQNALTIQEEVEKAFRIYFRQPVSLTGSSRTDAGVHALQNYFHLDESTDMIDAAKTPAITYHLNAILPADIVIKSIRPVSDEAHCRFDASAREYRYDLYTRKDPFRKETAYYYPFPVDRNKLRAAAALLQEYRDFTSFSKRNTQVKTFECTLITSEWIFEEDVFSYHVVGNRFLRGMVRALTATMLKAGRGQISLEQFRQIIEAKDCTKAFFNVPAHGLFLVSVQFPPAVLKEKEGK